MKYTYDLDVLYLKKYLAKHRTLEITNILISKLGFDDMRDFVKSIGDWGYTTDFTYNPATRNWQSFLRQYIKEIIEEN